MVRWPAILMVLVSARGGPSSRADRWNGYLFAAIAAGAGMTIAGPFAAPAECRGAAMAQASRTDPRAGHARGRGCPAPREGAVADGAQATR